MSILFDFPDDCKGAVAAFAKNFLPILFNLYTTEPENLKDPMRLACFETVKCYLKITDKQVYNNIISLHNIQSSNLNSEYLPMNKSY